MLTIKNYIGIKENTPFLILLSKAVTDAANADVFVTGEYAYSYITEKTLPKSIELRSSLSIEEMSDILSAKGIDFVLHTNEIVISIDDRRYIYSQFSEGTLENDSKIQGFSMYAMYISLTDGSVCDPQSAVDDINAEQLSLTDEPDKIFSAKPIRIMNMVKLCCEHNLAITDEILTSAKKYSSGLVNANPDHVRVALFAVLMSDASKAYDGMDISGDNSPVLRGLLMFRKMDVYAAILPELEAGKGVEQKKRYHMYDVQEHMLHTSSSTPQRLYIRVAGLLHDIGKPYALEQNNGKNMHGHDRIGAGMARVALRRLHCKEDFINKVCRIIAIHMYDIAGIAKVDTLRKRFALWGYVLTQDIIDFRFSDVAGSGCPDRNADSAVRFREIFEQMKADGTPFSIYELKITGKDIAQKMGLNSGAEINDVKRELLRHCAVCPEDNEHDTLMKLLDTVTVGE